MCRLGHLLITIFWFLIALISTRRDFSTLPTVINPFPRNPRRSLDSPRDAIQRPVLCGRRIVVPAEPNAFRSFLKSCAEQKMLMEGRRLHVRVIVTGFNHDTVVSNHLINMYGKCGSLGDAHLVFDGLEKRNLFSWNTLIGCYCKSGCLLEARELFDGMPSRDSVSWNIMISGYDHYGPCEEAVEIFARMMRSGCCVDHYGVSSVISACSNIRLLASGKGLHGISAKTGLDSKVQVSSALVELYGKCSEIDDSRKVFDGMAVREQFTWNSMLAGYIQCSKVDDAILFLTHMPEKNLVSWTTIIAGCSQYDRNEEAVGFFYGMCQSGMKLDQVSAASVLSACTGSVDLEEGCKIHGLIVKSGLETNPFITSTLVALYANCGNLAEARSVIDNMPLVDDFSWSVLIAEYARHGQIECACEIFGSLKVKNLSLWNALITSYSEAGLYEKAIEAFKEMCMRGIVGDEFTFGTVLKGSHNLDVRYGKQLHLQTIKVGVDSSVFVGSALIGMYSGFSECEAAKQVFYSIEKPNLVFWNAMIFGYGQNNMCLEAINTLQLMMNSTMKADNITFSCVLDSCSSLLALDCGMQLHALVHKAGFESDAAVGSALVSMYGKCQKMDHASLAFSDIHQHNVVSWTALLGVYVRYGMWDSASEIFNMMPERNIVSWNTMISGHAQHGSSLDAVKLYIQMNKLGVFPDCITFASLLTACRKLLMEEQGKQIHGHIIKLASTCMHAHINIALNDMYQKLGKIPERKNSALISSPCEQGKPQDTDEPHALSLNI